MPKFRKKPVIIEAVQWKGNNLEEIRSFLNDPSLIESGGTFVINTLEGPLLASLNDWIIQGVQGELYPCKPDIFEATYEKV